MYYKFVYSETHKKSQVSNAEPVAYVQADNYKDAKSRFYRYMREDGIGIRSTKRQYVLDSRKYHSLKLI